MTRAHDVLRLDLDDLPLAPAEIQAGSPRAAIATLHEFAGTEVGVWELTEGTVTDVEADEIFVVLSGAGTVTFDSGEMIDLRPGTLVRLYEGERTVWTVTQPLRKVWITS